ncbi:MAG: tetratricopeptide repeat protein [Planctomycetes bacterium]|nr:tetratricopeptide repeat protein [Planctomycetota bacterium]
MNRRFVPYYFNRSGMGEGGNAAASAFTKGRTKNPYAYFAAFAPDGTYLGESALYATKDEVLAWLRKLLDDHPECDKPTPEEERAEGLAAARVLEETGRFKEARERYAAIGSPLDEARLARYAGDFEAHEKALARVGAADEAAAERGLRLVAERKWSDARAALEKAVRAHPESGRQAEMRFALGVACWFLDDRDWAKFHWMWVVENLPDDRLYMRCKVAAAAEIMPYENPELDNHAAKGNIGTEHIVREVAKSRAVYGRLLPLWQKGP